TKAAPSIENLNFSGGDSVQRVVQWMKHLLTPPGGDPNGTDANPAKNEGIMQAPQYNTTKGSCASSL
ncbi:MAG: hypothetical protein OIF58_00685, partial [Cohaesibacter sp.]|nr:hypothetical protein [Cohaesibacter sp.]